MSDILIKKVIEQQGLEKSIVHFAKDVAGSIKFSLELEYSVKNISSSFEAFLYRTTTELIFNSLKISEAGRIRLCIRQSTGSLVYLYGDNGNGFDDRIFKDQVLTESSGLNTIISKITAHNGLYSLRSQKGEGMLFEMVFNNNEVL